MDSGWIINSRFTVAAYARGVVKSMPTSIHRRISFIDLDFVGFYSDFFDLNLSHPHSRSFGLSFLPPEYLLLRVILERKFYLVMCLYVDRCSQF